MTTLRTLESGWSPEQALRDRRIPEGATNERHSLPAGTIRGSGRAVGAAPDGCRAV
ncbi:hypothetical protein RAJCM14343_3211 [Rhodococcus aetherivorans]|uniref:Uncharacterized protein n=1 Tax=Rhodococcus aetherivorans TaxID=191292 RepID=A0ABQ0YNA8_9NOCA|nr:hypothetical protein RAJCM14343_3211 [Rhodococcus aetherivorans]CCW15465.1 hypothetical protein EBESD8_60380 [Rhodococcus aetherivorans]